MIFLNRGEEGSSASTIRKGSCKFARKPDYMTIAQLGKDAELEIVYLETGRPNSSQDKRWRDHKKLIQLSKDSIDTTRILSKLKRMFNQFSKRQNLTIFAINIAGNALYFYFSSTILYLLLLYYKLIVNNHVAFILGDVIELYAIRKESGIYKFCLIEEATIPLHMTLPSAVVRGQDHPKYNWWLFMKVQGVSPLYF